jgi:hypothetical protein
MIRRVSGKFFFEIRDRIDILEKPYITDTIRRRRRSMKRFTMTVLVLALCAAASFAQVFDFTLTNKTGYTIDEIYVTPADASHWGEDVLDVDTLANGKSVEIKFHPDYEKILLAFGVDLYDLKVVYADNSEDVWQDLKLEEIEKITLSLDKNGNGIAVFE